MADEGYTAEYINDLVKRSGKSRATVYRKLEAGWSEDEIVTGRRTKAEAENELGAATAATEIDDLFPKQAPKPKAAPPVEEPTSIDPPAEDDGLFALKWARAVMWAADHVDVPKKQMTRQKAGSALNYNLFLLGKDNLRELHGNLVPKALNIIDKHRNPEGGDIAKAEERHVDELLPILKQALEESNRQWVERN